MQGLLSISGQLHERRRALQRPGPPANRLYALTLTLTLTLASVGMDLNKRQYPIRRPRKREASKVTRECGERHLAKQLVLLNRCPIVALGGRSQKRVKYLKHANPASSERVIGAFAAAPPGCNHNPARSSWENAARKVRDRLDNAA